MTRKFRFNLPGVPGTLLPLSAIHGFAALGHPARRSVAITANRASLATATLTVISMICGRPLHGRFVIYINAP